MRTKYLFVLIHIGNKGGWGLYHNTGLIPLVKYLLTVPRRCLFCGSFLLFMFCVCHAFLSVHCKLVVTCWERANLLALLYVCFRVFLSLSHVVSWVSCGNWLYRFLIFSFLLTFLASRDLVMVIWNLIMGQKFVSFTKVIVLAVHCLYLNTFCYMTVGKVLHSLAETACNSFPQKRMLTVSIAVFDNRLCLLY